jgi:hypothetical protein
MKQLLSTLAIAGVSLSFTATRADALPKTFGDVYEECQPLLRFWSGQASSTGNQINAGWCIGVISTTRLYMQQNCILAPANSGFWRADTNGHSDHALLQSVINFAKDNPAQWSKSVALGVSVALEDGFPCKD